MDRGDTPSEIRLKYTQRSQHCFSCMETRGIDLSKVVSVSVPVPDDAPIDTGIDNAG